MSGIKIQSSIPLTFVIHNERKNASQNRNFGASILQTDILSFFDADDIMHPQRCEAILRASKQSDITLHSYTQTCDFETYSDFEIDYGKLQRAPSGCAIHIDDWRKLIHHSQVSVRKSVFNSIQFREGSEFERKEDSVFCGDVLQAGFKNAYISNILSKYDISGSWS
jgi:glycosyltransferase involved in cell wall biosynthesis